VHATATNSPAQSGSSDTSSLRFVIRTPVKMDSAPAATLIRPLIWSVFPLITVLLSFTEANRQAVVSCGYAASCRVVNKIMKLSVFPFPILPGIYAGGDIIVSL
jgi:hypothetical protein